MVERRIQTYTSTMMKKINVLWLLSLVVLASLPAQSDPLPAETPVDPVSEIILWDLEEKVLPELQATKLSFTIFGSVESVVGLGLAGAGVVGIGLSAQMMIFPPLGIGGMVISGAAAGAGAIILGDGWRNLSFGLGYLPPLPAPSGLASFRKTMAKDVSAVSATRFVLGFGLVYVGLATGITSFFDHEESLDALFWGVGLLALGSIVIALPTPLENIWFSHVSRFPLRPEEIPEEPKNLTQP